MCGERGRAALNNGAKMLKEIPAEILVLIPNGIENFVPSCVVCKRPVPARRATSRSKNTCSNNCNAVLQMFRRWNLFRRKCPTCYHPSTPEERQDFKAWRKERKQLRMKPGKPIGCKCRKESTFLRKGMEYTRPAVICPMHQKDNTPSLDNAPSVP